MFNNILIIKGFQVVFTGFISTELAMAIVSLIGPGPQDFRRVMDIFSDNEEMQYLLWLYYSQIVTYFITFLLHLATLFLQPRFKRVEIVLTYFYIAVLAFQLLFFIEGLTAQAYIRIEYDGTLLEKRDESVLLVQFWLEM